jgi:predicted RNase H-like HicB family nuclease
MKYPIAIRIRGDLAAFDVAVPDMPGCFSAGDGFDEALKKAEEAALAWIEATRAAGGDVPAPSSLQVIRRHPDYAGWILSWIDIDTSPSTV